MIVVICPQCSSKLHAKDELAGQTRKCPKCAGPVHIALPKPEKVEQPDDLSADAPADTPADVPTETRVPSEAPVALPHEHSLPRLDRQHYYLVCDRGRVLAIWEGNGRGWMLKTNTGLIAATRGDQQLPPQGDFRLVEVVVVHEEAGVRLTGLRVFRLMQHWALAALTKGDDEIVRKIVGPGGLNREQKGAVRAAIKERYMQDVWGHAEAVLEYLANADALSSGA